MLKIFSKLKFLSIFFILYLIFDIILFSILPENFKSSLYNNRAHRIKSYYYHHDLRPLASFYDNWGYQRYKIFTNNLGFKDESKKKIEFKERNILFIGDSFTEGVGLKYEDTYVGNISKKLDKINKNIKILNAGVQSYSTSIYLSKIYHLIYREKIPITDIVVMVSGGDFFDDKYKYLDVNENYVLNHIDFKNKYLIKFINFYKSNTLIYQFISRITPPKKILDIYKSFKLKENFLNNKTEKELMKISDDQILNMDFLKRKDYSYFFSKNEFNLWGKSAIDESIKNLKKIINITEKKNIRINFLYIYEPTLIIREPDKEVYDYVINSFKTLETSKSNFYVIENYYKDFENKFEAYKNLFFINDIHWNKKCNKLVAKEILEKINFNK